MPIYKGTNFSHSAKKILLEVYGYRLFVLKSSSGTSSNANVAQSESIVSMRTMPGVAKAEWRANLFAFPK